MNLRPSKVVLLAGLVLMQATASAAVPPEVVQELMKQSGLWARLNVLGGQVNLGVDDGLQKGGASADTRLHMMGCAETAYSGSAMHATATQAIAGALRQDDIAPLRAWYDSPLGRKVSGMEQASAKQMMDSQERLRFGNELLLMTSASRKASLQAIIVETRWAEAMADAAIETSIAVQEGVADANGQDSPASRAHMRAQLSSRRPDLVARFGQMALPSHALTYQGLDDEELRRYAEHLASESAKSFGDSEVRGVARALSDASAAQGRCIRN